MIQLKTIEIFVQRTVVQARKPTHAKFKIGAISDPTKCGKKLKKERKRKSCCGIMYCVKYT